jgi:hypothetical protein
MRWRKEVSIMAKNKKVTDNDLNMRKLSLHNEGLDALIRANRRNVSAGFLRDLHDQGYRDGINAGLKKPNGALRRRWERRYHRFPEYEEGFAEGTAAALLVKEGKADMIRAERDFVLGQMRAVVANARPKEIKILADHLREPGALSYISRAMKRLTASSPERKLLPKPKSVRNAGKRARPFTSTGE